MHLSSLTFRTYRASYRASHCCELAWHLICEKLLFEKRGICYLQEKLAFQQNIERSSLILIMTLIHAFFYSNPTERTAIDRAHFRI